ncbi:MAG TPA: ABC transporter permease, partial [Acidobacteriota bacterium]|nr:ABC transporter permease [Acidobacteriota bacterium]
MHDWRKEIQPYLERLKLDPPRELEIVEELTQHLNDKYEELLRTGLTPEQSYKAVVDDLSAGKLADELRKLLSARSEHVVLGEERKENWLKSIWKDLRYGARLLKLNPGFAIVAILSLGLGIGANTALFQLLDAVRLRSLPVKNPDELAYVRITNAPQGRTGSFNGYHPELTNAIWENLRDQQQAFSSMGSWWLTKLNMSQSGEIRYADTLYVSGQFFHTLGTQPLMGRLISRGDDVPGCASSGAVISHSFWQREYGGSKSVLGKEIRLEGHPFEIIGVTPGNFFGMQVGHNFDVAIPVCVEPVITGEEPRIGNNMAWWLAAVGRLKPDWTIKKAASHLATISPGIFKSTLPPKYDPVDSKNYLNFKLNAEPASTGVSDLREDYEKPLWLLMGIAGLVLLIACANLANLMVARASAREREMAVRLALGASRSRLVRQLLAESLMLASIGALFGVALAQVLSRLLVSFLSTERIRLFLDLKPDWHMLLFTAALAIFTCILFGLTPAIQAARTPPGEVMKAHSRGLTAARSRFGLRRILVVSQVALSLVLLISALLFVGTFRNLLVVDAGFQQDRILVSIIDFSRLKIPMENRAVYKKEMLSRVRSLPQVQSAADVAIVPLSGNGWNENISIPGSKVQRKIANFNQVTSGYFKTVGTALLAGRDFNANDTPTSPRVAIVTETFVRKFMNGVNPVGATLERNRGGGDPPDKFQIIGLVKESKYSNLREEFIPLVYIADSQDTKPYPEMQIMVRTNEPLPSVIVSIKQVAMEMNPANVMRFQIFRTIIREGLLRERLMASLSGFFGLLAAVLAMTGLYGVISFMVERRRNEIGIRIALGANERSILSMILREATSLLAIGIVIGAVLALLAGAAAKAL